MDYIWKSDILRRTWNASMSCWWLYMFMCIYAISGYISLCAYMLWMIIYVYVHVCCWWLYMFKFIYVVGEYICLRAYMLLVNNSYMLLVVNFGVSMYWTMLLWICGIRMKYVLSLSSPKFTHSCCWISSPCWWRILVYSTMQGVMMCLLH